MVLETFYFCLFDLADIKKEEFFWFLVWNIQCGSSGNGSHMLYQNYGKQKQLRDNFFWNMCMCEEKRTEHIIHVYIWQGID